MTTVPIILIVVLLAGLGAVGWLFYTMARKRNVWGLATLAGLIVSFLIWAAIAIWPHVPVVALVLVVIAAAVTFILSRVGGDVLVRGVAIAAVVLVALVLVWQVAFVGWLNAPVLTEVDTLNDGGASGTALLVYHPGKSDFQKQAMYAFAEGLVSVGWQVDLATASIEAPTDLSGYDLLVLGAPTYAWSPARRIRVYLDGLGDLNGQPTIAIVTGAVSTDLAAARMDEWVTTANGDLRKTLVLWTQAPNEELYGISDPAAIMRREAQSLSAPGG